MQIQAWPLNIASDLRVDLGSSVPLKAKLPSAKRESLRPPREAGGLQREYLGCSDLRSHVHRGLYIGQNVTFMFCLLIMTTLKA